MRFNRYTEVRAQCWFEANLGVRSVKQQWGPMIKEIFEIAHFQGDPEECIDRALDVILKPLMVVGDDGQ